MAHIIARNALEIVRQSTKTIICSKIVCRIWKRWFPTSVKPESVSSLASTENQWSALIYFLFDKGHRPVASLLARPRVLLNTSSHTRVIDLTSLMHIHTETIILAALQRTSCMSAMSTKVYECCTVIEHRSTSGVINIPYWTTFFRAGQLVTWP